MQERDMVNDVLSTTKSSLTAYTSAISECGNQVLRGTLQQLRNEAEQFQYQLFQIASTKGYYSPAPEASTKDIQDVKNGLSAGESWGGTTK